MKIILEINNQTGCNLDEKKLKLAIEETIGRSGKLKNLSFNKSIVISLGFVSSKEIQKMNKKYRSKDSSTDVLSFASYDKEKNILKEESNEIFLGDLVICCEDIERYIKREGILFGEEIIRVVSHGTLHLLGFSHGNKMFDIQEAIVKNNK